MGSGNRRHAAPLVLFCGSSLKGGRSDIFSSFEGIEDLSHVLRMSLAVGAPRNTIIRLDPILFILHLP